MTTIDREHLLDLETESDRSPTTTCDVVAANAPCGHPLCERCHPAPLTVLDTKALATLSANTAQAMRAAPRGPERTAIRASYKLILAERGRREWNAKSTQQRADGVLYTIQQTEAEWYEQGEQDPAWKAMRAWVDGEAGAIEACEAAGISLADR